MPYFGRRTLFLWGLYVNTAIYFIIGGLGVPHGKPNLSWGIASLLVANGFICYVCMIPIVFALVPEVPSALLRSKSVPIGRFVYTIVNVAANVLTAYQINPSAWAWGGKTGFFWGVSSLLGIVMTYFFLPETKDRTVAELDLLFEKRVPARKFAETHVDAAEVTFQAKA